MSFLNKMLRECREYMEFLFIPLVAAIVPWWLAIRFFRLVAYIPFFYQSNADACVKGAEFLGLLGEDAAEWKRNCKVCQMVDAADVFLMATRGTQYLDKYVEEEISAQLSEPQMICFPHYGAGMWIYKILLKKNVKTALLVNPSQGRLTAEGLLAKIRIRVLVKHGVTLIPSNDMGQLRQVLKDKKTIFFSPDMPFSEGKGAFQIPTDLGELNVMSRFFEMAEKRQLSVLNCVFGLDVKTGKREFEASAVVGEDAKDYAKYFTALTIKAIKKRPYLWRMMVMAPQVMLSNQSGN